MLRFHAGRSNPSPGLPSKRRWLPPLAAGEILGAFALTEPGSGSDAAALKTSARRYGDEYVLTGTKVFITNAGRAGLYIVFARTGSGEKASGISAFIVPGDTPGLRVGQVFKKMGLHGSPTGELVLEEVRVPAENLLNAEGKGFQVAMRALDSGRIGISGQALGIAQAALSEAQVFDSEGRPWPTLLQQQGFGDEGSCSIMIAGRPTAPLSLALLVTPVGADIEIPIVLEKVPVTIISPLAGSVATP